MDTKQFPKEYRSQLDFFETQKAIDIVKETFSKELSSSLNLVKVSSPRFLEVGTGLQDDLALTQVPVSFQTIFSDTTYEIIHSLAKWKRDFLGKHSFAPGRGIYTDMHAIRKDESVSRIHSISVDQWDWEKVLMKEERTLDYLKKTVLSIYNALKKTQFYLKEIFPQLKSSLPEKITFVHTEDLEKEFPDLTSKEREDTIAKRFGAVFIIGIGYPLLSGEPHDVRASDYDDWISETSEDKKGLNGDIIVWDDISGSSLELSSMGIRVDADALEKQLSMHGLHERKTYDFHSKVLSDILPLTIGGGIGQSRLCMFLLEKYHIAEVQSSVWPKEVVEDAKSKGIFLF